jgi:type IV secretory pathway VirJ component
MNWSPVLRCLLLACCGRASNRSCRAPRRVDRLAPAALLLAFLGIAAQATAQDPSERNFEFADLGVTRLLAGGADGLVVILADKASAAEADALAGAVAATKRSAAIVDLDGYLARVGADGADCFNASTRLDDYAQQVQQELKFERFGAASLIGVGRGAAFVPLLLRVSRAGLFAAGVSAGAQPPLQLPVPPCGALAGKIGWKSPQATVALPPDLPTTAPWAASADPAPAAVLRVLDGLFARAAPGDAPADLPLVELPQPAGNQAPWFALVISGDGGWRDIDQSIAEELGRRGIPVLGWNSLRYFWEAKTPDTTGEDLTRAVRHYLRAWGKERVLLIGYSLGADVLPFMVSRAPADVRAAIEGIVLLNPAKTVDFQFHISNWLGDSDAAPYELEPETRKLTGIPIQCIYGSEEGDDSLCPALAGRKEVLVRQLPGDHHFDDDYGTVTSTILSRFPAGR